MENCKYLPLFCLSYVKYAFSYSFSLYYISYGMCGVNLALVYRDRTVQPKNGPTRSSNFNNLDRPDPVQLVVVMCDKWKPKFRRRIFATHMRFASNEIHC